jgi:hypothetical protein
MVDACPTRLHVLFELSHLGALLMRVYVPARADFHPDCIEMDHG